MDINDNSSNQLIQSQKSGKVKNLLFWVIFLILIFPVLTFTSFVLPEPWGEFFIENWLLLVFILVPLVTLLRKRSNYNTLLKNKKTLDKNTKQKNLIEFFSCIFLIVLFSVLFFSELGDFTKNL